MCVIIIINKYKYIILIIFYICFIIKKICCIYIRYFINFIQEESIINKYKYIILIIFYICFLIKKICCIYIYDVPSISYKKKVKKLILRNIYML